MEVKELMVDDWVYNKRHKENIQITPYDFFTHGHLPSGRQYFIGEPEVVSGRDLEPIPLTQEILERNGFVKSVNVRDAPPYDNNIYYSIKQDENTIFWGWWQPDNTLLIATYSTGLIALNNVHELQHALRLYRIEKEIVL